MLVVCAHFIALRQRLFKLCNIKSFHARGLDMFNDSNRRLLLLLLLYFNLPSKSDAAHIRTSL